MEETHAYKGQSMRLGGGGRFRKLKEKLAKRGARTPGALAAYIGRKKYGKGKMTKWSVAGRKAEARKRFRSK